MGILCGNYSDLIRFCISSTEGSCLLKPSGRLLVILYSLTPMGLLMSFKAYSATRAFLLLQSSKPIDELFKHTVNSRQIEIKLSRIFGLKLTCFQFNDDIAAKIEIIEQKIHIKIIAAYV